MTIPTPDYTPVTALAIVTTAVTGSAAVHTPEWPTTALDTPTGTGVQSAVSRPILLTESGEPLETEGPDYLLMEGT